MAKVKYATDSNGEKLYLIGHTQAVYDENGAILEDRLTQTDSDISDIQTQLNDKADTEHTHKKTDITDFPTSMTPTSHA